MEAKEALEVLKDNCYHVWCWSNTLNQVVCQTCDTTLEKYRQALQAAIASLEREREAKGMMPEELRRTFGAKKLNDEKLTESDILEDYRRFGYNQALSDCLPAFQKLLREIEKLKKEIPLNEEEKKSLDNLKQENTKLKQGTCEHVAKNTIGGDCKLCELAVAEKGYPIWVKRAKDLKQENAKLKKQLMEGK